ncbi:MAG TPA: CoA transferase [Candidatus Baltobacteraceae bacterium]|jgi:crotonobetainyl-CoA:carnitine CoA-transferase CaiB-like acyl-CoA transferase|nr:CoA transferase [Candidatus Baltobacteraceae bacterium]
MSGLNRPLTGVRVLALVTNIPGPLAASRLARLGADVTKVEPVAGDPLERAAPRWYADLVAGVNVQRLDLRCSQATLLAQLAKTDLLLTAMRARSLAALGLSWAQLHETFPSLSHVAIAGEAAPNDDRAGHDLTYQARAGLLAPPQMPRTVFADMFAAERAVAACILALYARARGGEATRSEIAIADGARELGAAVRHGLTSPGGSLSGSFAGYALYRTADGWIALAALEPHFQQRLCSALSAERIDRETFEAKFREHPTAYWESLAQREDLPLAAVV